MKVINIILAIIGTLFLTGITGSFVVGAIWSFGFSVPVAIIGVVFVCLTLVVGGVAITDAMEVW